MNTSTKETYSEVYSILNLFGPEYINKLPKKLYKLIEAEKLDSYSPKYTIESSLESQNIKKESISMIALFHLKYWCENEDEQEQLKKIFQNNQEIQEKEIRKKYNPDNIFKNKVSATDNKEDGEEENEDKKEAVALTEYKIAFLQKIFNKIKNFFKK